uniref:G-protein coupled receptors family 1 profile domain-containing protein n=1 Tax=Plectus sambesii TaxID=2011161 RepID=A0A914X2P1_9BILA
MAYGIGALHWLLAWIEPLMNLNETTSALCDAAAIAPVFYTYSKYLTSIVSLSSVVVYGVVVVKLEHRLTLLQECVDARAHSRQAKIQRRLTVTFGLISFCTLLFDAIPCAWGMYLYTHTLFDGDESIYCGSIAPYLFLLNKVDAVCNVVIVFYRHQDIRLALKCLFLNRPISPKFSHMAYLQALQATKTRRHQQLLLTFPTIIDETKSL